MRFLLLSEAGDGLGFALRMKDEGNQVWVWTKTKRFAAPNGLVDHLPSVDAGLAKNPECIIVDSVGMGALADSLKKRGYNVFGGGQINDRLEDDRDFAMKIAKEAGLKMPPFESFKKTAIRDAIKHVKESKKRFVLKPKGKEWSNLTYVGKDAEDMIGFLNYIDSTGAIKGDFLLQEFVEGIEVSTNLHFHDGLPIYPADNTMELKKFMNDDLGPATGASAAVVWVGSDSHKIVKATFEPMLKWLRQVKFTGPIDINTIVNGDGAYFLEFTPRFGYNAHYCLASMFEDELGKVFSDLSTGKLKRMPYGTKKLSFGLRVTVPPYPLDPYNKENFPAYDLSAGHVVSDFPEKNSWLLDVKQTKDGLVTGGLDGLVMELAYAGNDLQKLADRAYADAKAIKLPDKQYRTDGIQRVLEQWPKLKQMGYEVPI